MVDFLHLQELQWEKYSSSRATLRILYEILEECRNDYNKDNKETKDKPLFGSFSLVEDIVYLRLMKNIALAINQIDEQSGIKPNYIFSKKEN